MCIVCHAMTALSLVATLLARDLCHSSAAGSELPHIDDSLNRLCSQQREALQVPSGPIQLGDEVLGTGWLPRKSMSDGPHCRDLVVSEVGSGHGSLAVLALRSPTIQAWKGDGDDKRQHRSEGLRPSGLALVSVHPRADIRNVA